MSARGYIIVTRPEKEAQDYAQELRAAGFKALSAPMLSIKPIAFDFPNLDDYQALLFTSANAVRVFCDRAPRRDIPVYVVGQYTASEAKDQGFENVVVSDEGGDALAALVDDHVKDRLAKLLHVRGVHVARAIDELLVERGYKVDILKVYEAQSVYALPSDVLDAVRAGTVNAVTFFSKRTAENFINLARENDAVSDLQRIKALCISSSVLKYVQAVSWADTYKSEKPHRASMLALIKETCEQS